MNADGTAGMSLAGPSATFKTPFQVIEDKAGNIYVADATTSLIQVFDPTGALLLAFDGHGSPMGEFFSPSGLAIDADGNLFIVDLQQVTLSKYSLTLP